VKEELGERDRLDSTRDESPLRKADDAIELDTSALTIDQQVAAVVATAHRVMGEREKK
jgi:cytidylate kinase